MRFRVRRPIGVQTRRVYGLGTMRIKKCPDDTIPILIPSGDAHRPDVICVRQDDPYYQRLVKRGYLRTPDTLDDDAKSKELDVQNTLAFFKYWLLLNGDRVVSQSKNAIKTRGGVMVRVYPRYVDITGLDKQDVLNLALNLVYLTNRDVRVFELKDRHRIRIL